VDDKGKGRWFPCQSAGKREFGGISEMRPILQKGDNFRPPKGTKERQRYMAERVVGTPAPVAEAAGAVGSRDGRQIRATVGYALA